MKNYKENIDDIECYKCNKRPVKWITWKDEELPTFICNNCVKNSNK